MWEWGQGGRGRRGSGSGSGSARRSEAGSGIEIEPGLFSDSSKILGERPRPRPREAGERKKGEWRGRRRRRNVGQRKGKVKKRLSNKLRQPSLIGHSSSSHPHVNNTFISLNQLLSVHKKLTWAFATILFLDSTHNLSLCQPSQLKKERERERENKRRWLGPHPPPSRGKRPLSDILVDEGDNWVT